METGSALGLARSLERALVSIRGIRKARVEIAPDNTSVAVEVLAVPERSETALRADVARVARSILGSMPVSATNVLVAERPARPGPDRPRRKLSSLVTRRTKERFSTQVILSRGGDVATGEADAHPDHHPERVVAQAILDGLDQVSARPLELHDVETVRVGEDVLALVCVNFGEQRLLGSAEVRFDVADAIARATLHALNRPLGREL